MNITDKIVKEWSWRCSKGYPDINNPEDKKILDQLLQEWGAPKIEAAPAPILEDDGEPEITFDALMDLLQSKKDSLPPDFLKKIYTQVQTKGKKLTSKLIDILNQKGMEEAKEVILSITDRFHIEEKLLKYLESDNRPGLEALRANSGGSLVGFLTKETGLPQPFVESLVEYSAAKDSKGVGRVEYALALLVKGGAKKKVGDVEIEGKTVEVKADEARLSKREGSLRPLFQTLEQITQIAPRPKENLEDYIKTISAANPSPDALNAVQGALNKEFEGTFADVDITNPAEVRRALLTWYVNVFFATEPSDLILLYMTKNYKLFTPEEFRAAMLSGEIKFKSNFSQSNKAPQVVGF
jgi:hypothetical protein